MEIKLYYVYILTNAYDEVLYTSITNDLERRCYEHKQKIVKIFTVKYNVDKLVFFEQFDFIDLVISREKLIKGYSRAKIILELTSVMHHGQFFLVFNALNYFKINYT
jgi:putative endonuclease